MRLKLIPEAILKKEGVETSTISLKFNHLTPAVYQALQTLEEEPHFEDIEELSCYYYYLDLLKKHGLIIYRTPLIELVPLNANFLHEESPEGAYQLSRFALCRSDNGELIIETPLSPLRVHLYNPDALPFFFALRKPLTLEEILKEFLHLPAEGVKETFSLLVSAKILTNGEESPNSRQWEFHDLFFHSRSREGRHNAPIGGTFRFKGAIPSQPAIKPCTQKGIIELQKPEKTLTFSIEEAILQRKSIRKHGEKPITLQQLEEFLYRCARVKKLFIREEEEFTSRPYPGGGSLYEFELYLVVYNCEGIKQGVYHYHPLAHQLCNVSEFNSLAEKLLHDAKRSSAKEEYPQVLIVVSARFQRVFWKYQSMAYALILKDLGVLIQTMYLVATAMELAPCAIGSGNSDLFCELIGTNYLEESSVGEFMLGSLPVA